MGEAAAPGPGEEDAAGVADHLTDTGFSQRRKIWVHDADPSLIFTDAKLQATNLPKSAESHHQYETFTNALFKLWDYGIHFAGIGNARGLSQPARTGNEPFQWETAYATTRRIEGHNMHLNMSEIPMAAVLQALEAILCYYEDMVDDASGAFYLTDLGLPQLVYGLAPGDEAPAAYFVDFESAHVANDRSKLSFNNLAMRKLAIDIDRAEELYQQPFDEYRQRLAAIRERLR